MILRHTVAVRDSAADSLVHLFGEERPAFAGLQEKELIEKLAGRVSISFPR
jgi:hypothetical protein